MPTFLKPNFSAQKLLGAEEITVDEVSALKTSVFCLESSNQLAARLGGAASLIEAQALKSHGKPLVEAKLKAKVAAVRSVVKKTRAELGMHRIEVKQIWKRNSTAENIVPVDPAVSDEMYKAVAKALRAAQADTFGVANVTLEASPSTLSSKAKMLGHIYLTAKKQSILAKMRKPSLLMLNKSVVAKSIQ